jgi:hypothetical protein
MHRDWPFARLRYPARHARHHHAIHRVAFVAVGGLAAGPACRLPDWNWHRFPLNDTVVNVASLAFGSLLAGVVLAALIPGRP